MIISGGGDNKSYLWRSDTGEKLHELSGHDDSVVSVSFSKDGQYVATGGMDGKIMVWKVENGQHVATLEGPNEITWLDWHPKGNVILAGTAESTIWMWQIPSGNFMNLFAGHSASVTAGQFTPDGKKIVTGSEDSSLIVWDPKNATSIFKLSNDDSRFHHEGITSLAINKENSLVLTEHAALLTAQAEAKRAHHIADFLPKTELVKFEEEVKAIKTGGPAPQHEDYASNKLDQSNIGFKMLMKQGWQAGSGLGKSGEGISAPVNKADTRPTNAGLGQTKPDDVQEEDDEFEIYRKRMMLAYRFRPNPLVCEVFFFRKST
ncbi:9093_t:CDS:2 [Entrophospora sp. SA101]|nr:9093_t:CDS:2 [Entrophospora sp. SA101]